MFKITMIHMSLISLLPPFDLPMAETLKTWFHLSLRHVKFFSWSNYIIYHQNQIQLVSNCHAQFYGWFKFLISFHKILFNFIISDSLSKKNTVDPIMLIITH